ncbi:lebercilin-like protein isoform X1 [Bombus terrestris]|uniref:Lebercilin-like protein isoform X1 n=2 Tax=Bombus terrestris TaxID=30195 RepID=A0A9B2MNI1_BOMTE|nr:lebercilin-like protein isoform X1 [Bombus terrestris]
MQTEVPPLPVVHFNAHKNLNRRQNSNLARSSVETKINSSHKNIAYLSSKKKILHPLLVRPYQSNVQQCPSLEQSKPNKSSIEQRVLSAKMLRIKELQNQLADAHYRLNELATENKLLRALQKRQDSALKRYEGTNAELPRIINSHHEELRVLQIKYKKLKTLQKETCNLLKEKENELQQLQSQNKHLLQLSKDRNLGEREKLQIEVSDLNHRIQQQQDTIKTLHKKLTLETKSLKQQLHLEISKRRETQKHLDETTEKLRSLENLLDNRERRLYYSGQLLFPDKNRRFGTQSLTNLRDISSSNPLKIPSKNKKWQTDIQKDSLPMLHTSELNEKNIKTEERIISNQTLDCIKSETMTNLEQVRRYRLQKSPYKSTLNNSEEKSREVDFSINENSEFSIGLEKSEQLGKQHKEEEKYQISAVKFRKIYNNRKCQNFISSSGGSESENENEHENDTNNYTNATNNSKQLHARLISSADETSDSKDSDCKYRNKLRVLVKERKNSYVSDSEIESEIRKQSIEHYLTVNHQNDTLKLISSVYDNQAHNDSDKETEKFTSSKNILNESQNVYQSLIDEMHIQTKNVGNENIYAEYDIHTEYRNSGNIENYMFGQAPSKIQEFNNVSMKKDDFKNESSLQTYSKNEHDVSFETNIEPVDIESKISHTNETLFNGTQKRSSTQDLLNSSQNLNKATINKVDTTEVGILSENMLLQNYSLETKNKLNKNEFQNVDMISHNVQSHDNDSVHDTLTDVSTMSESNIKTKMTDYNKEKLLASMKAIDNNENIEFLNQDYEKHNITRRKQIIENVFPDLPSHMKKKQEIIKDIFDTDVIKNESTDSCNKLH